MAWIYAKLDRDREARYHMEKVLEFNPRFNLDARSKTLLYKSKRMPTEKLKGSAKQARLSLHFHYDASFDSCVTRSILYF